MMAQRAAAQRGKDVETPYAFGMRGYAHAFYGGLDIDSQIALDSAFNGLEWKPIPDDARDLQDGRVFAVSREGYWIVYEIDDDNQALDVWGLLADE